MEKYCDICFKEITQEEIDNREVDQVTNMDNKVVYVHKKCFNELGEGE